MTLELSFLGSGNAFAPARYWSSFLLNDRYLFDAPPTLLPHLKKLGKDPGDIDFIFISHFHGDHFFGLPFLLLEYAELAPRTRDLTVIGPPGIMKRVQAVTDLAFSNVFRKDRGYLLNFIEASDGAEGEVAGCRYLIRQVPHVSNLEAFAIRLSCDAGTIAYSGDATMNDALAPLADGADAFVVECSCWSSPCGPHLTPSDVMELRRRISPRTKFILTHVESSDAPQEMRDAGMLVAEDLQSITI
jgi:ribonuclease BN (tRNA processing enzyme)